MLPWLDRAGRLSLLKLAVFLLLLIPGLWLALSWWLFGLGPRPFTEAIRETGLWSLRFLIATLAVTPLRRIGFWPKLFLIRRMVGLAALAYALTHLVLYAIDQNLDLVRIATEIAVRIYLTIGLVALIGLIALGLTSTDAAVRRMGPNWHRLHRIVYALAVLSLLHFAMQAKLNVSEPALWTGIFLILMGHRLLQRYSLTDGWWALPALAIAGALLTGLIEAGWYAVTTGVPAGMVLAANLDPSAEIRPALWVLAIGAGLAVLHRIRVRAAPSPRGERRERLRPMTTSASERSGTVPLRS